jgi:hypothetical protein
MVMECRGIGSSRRTKTACWVLLSAAMGVISGSSYALYRNGNVWPKSADGITRVPVCFISTGELAAAEDARQRALVKEVLGATWGRWMNIQFAGFGTCSAPPPNATLAVELRGEAVGGAGDIPDHEKHTSGHRGFQGSRTPTWGWLKLNGASDYRARNVITHEFGHGLAFEHEQSRPDAAGFCPDGDSPIAGTIVTAEYDDIAIMNYCSPGAYASRLDIEGAQTLYGTSAAGQWLKALPAISPLPLL